MRIGGPACAAAARAVALVTARAIRTAAARRGPCIAGPTSSPWCGRARPAAWPVGIYDIVSLAQVVENDCGDFGTGDGGVVPSLNLNSLYVIRCAWIAKFAASV